MDHFPSRLNAQGTKTIKLFSLAKTNARLIAHQTWLFEFELELRNNSLVLQL
jgi:hypothetical protein